MMNDISGTLGEKLAEAVESLLGGDLGNDIEDEIIKSTYDDTNIEVTSSVDGKFIVEISCEINGDEEFHWKKWPLIELIDNMRNSAYREEEEDIGPYIASIDEVILMLIQIKNQWINEHRLGEV
jgi:hypothetical protein